MTSEFNDVITVEVLRERVVRLGFENGEVRDIDLAPMLWGEAFERAANDDEFFAMVGVDNEIGTIVWPNGADLSPATLYRYSSPARRAS